MAWGRGVWRANGHTGIRAYGQAGIRADGQTDRRAGMLSQASLKNSIENFIVPASAILASEPTGTAQGASGETTDHVTSCLRSAGIGALDEPNDATLQGKTEYPQLPGIPKRLHQYWLDLADDDSGTSDLDDYKEAIDGDPLDQEDNGNFLAELR